MRSADPHDNLTNNLTNTRGGLITMYAQAHRQPLEPDWDDAESATKVRVMRDVQGPKPHPDQHEPDVACRTARP